MSATLIDLRAQRDRATTAAEEIISAAERGRRTLSHVEDGLVRKHMAESTALSDEIQRVELRKSRALSAHLDPESTGRDVFPQTLSAAYKEAFYKEYLGNAGRDMSAAMGESSTVTGGYAVPYEFEGTIIPLAVPDNAVRRLATVIPTTKDLRNVPAATRTAAAIKAEAAGFTSVDASLSAPFTLSAFTIGAQHTISMELAQDSAAFFAFCGDDLNDAVATLADYKYINGSGTNEPQGLLGNVGAGVTDEPDGNSNAVSINATFDVLDTLKSRYHDNATWLMSRATGVVIRKAQIQSNLFSPVWTRDGGVDYLHGYPVEYSSNMPTAARSNCPVLFGDFKRGYLIGERGGPLLRVKVLDQDSTLAIAGQIAIIGWLRADGRVRRSEAIQGITVSAS